jgi:hypothetical protein
MAEIKINFDLTLSRRFITVVGAVVIVLCAVPELDSESVTLSTYYPAPSGVYTNMITTSDTYLARDGGSVNINTTATVALAKLNVVGGSIAGNYGLTPRYANWASYGTGDGGAAIYNSSEGAYQALMLVGNNSGGGVRRVKVWDELTVNGNTIINGNNTVSGNETIGGNSTVSGYVTSNSYVRAATAIVSQQGPACGGPQEFTYPTPGGGTQALCPGQYVTTQTGYYSKYFVLPVDRGPNLVPPVNPTANYICCPCPSSGCTL